jgi:hypothetical protein
MTSARQALEGQPVEAHQWRPAFGTCKESGTPKRAAEVTSNDGGLTLNANYFFA